eukprot:m51a1_g3948 hypothetical protein (277) ;mRNA; f:312391-318082
MQHTQLLFPVALSFALVLVRCGASPLSCKSIQHDVHPDSYTGQHAVLVVGQSAPFSGSHAQLGTDVRAGIEAAFALANETSLLKFALTSLDDASDVYRQQSNVQQLLCSGANGMGPAFAIAGTVGSTASEATLGVLQASVGSDGVPVPYVGALTSSEALRTRSTVLQYTSAALSGTARTGVVLARAGGRDEVSAIVSLLESRWELLNGTAVFYDDTPLALDAVDFLVASLKALGVALLSHYQAPIGSSSGNLSGMAADAVRRICTGSLVQLLQCLK